MIRFSKFTWQSIRVKMIGGLLLIIVPLIGFLIYSNDYAIDVVRNQVANSNKDILTLYRDQVDAKLQEVDDYLIGLMVGAEIPAFELSPNPEERVYASQKIATNLSSSVLQQTVLDGLFVYVPSSDTWDVSISEINRKKWYVQKNGDDTYLVRLEDTLRKV